MRILRPVRAAGLAITAVALCGWGCGGGSRDLGKEVSKAVIPDDLSHARLIVSAAELDFRDTVLNVPQRKTLTVRNIDDLPVPVVLSTTGDGFDGPNETGVFEGKRTYELAVTFTPTKDQPGQGALTAKFYGDYQFTVNLFAESPLESCVPPPGTCLQMNLVDGACERSAAPDGTACSTDTCSSGCVCRTGACQGGP